MTPGERKLLKAIARAIPKASTQLTEVIADALETVAREEQEARKRCGIVGYPGGKRRTCELARDVAHEYHQDGSTRWIGYYREAGNLDVTTRTP